MKKPGKGVLSATAHTCGQTRKGARQQPKSPRASERANQRRSAATRRALPLQSIPGNPRQAGSCGTCAAPGLAMEGFASGMSSQRPA